MFVYQKCDINNLPKHHTIDCSLQARNQHGTPGGAKIF